MNEEPKQPENFESMMDEATNLKIPEDPGELNICLGCE